METRALMQKLNEDIEKYGKDKPVYYVMEGGLEDTVVGTSFLYHYFFEDEKPDETTMSKMLRSLQQSTLGDFRKENLISMRLLQMAGAQLEIDYKDCINADLYELYENSYAKYLKHREEDYDKFAPKYWDIKERFTVNPDDYIDFLKTMASDGGRKVSLMECCQQDLELFGEPHKITLHIQEEDGKAVVDDWLLSAQGTVDLYDNDLAEDEFYRESTLGELSVILRKQENGEYEPFVKDYGKSAKILEF